MSVQAGLYKQKSALHHHARAKTYVKVLQDDKFSSFALEFTFTNPSPNMECRFNLWFKWQRGDMTPVEHKAMRTSLLEKLNTLERKIEKVRVNYNPDSKSFVEPLWRMHMDRLIYRRRLLLDRMCD
jgi:hypothetical protein